MAKNDDSLPALGFISGIVAIPYNFFIGFVMGLAAPLAAIAAMVFGIRLVTGKLPFLKLSEEADTERRLLLELVEQDQVQALFAAEKEKVMGELSSFQEEMKALLEEAKAKEG